MRTTPAAEARTAREIADAVEPLVLELIAGYEALIGVLERHRAALRTADGRRLGPIIDEERDLLSRLADLDRRSRLALGRRPGEPGPTVSSVAQSLDEPARSRLADAAAYLRALHGRSEVLRGSVREASVAMASHLDGLMRQVAQRLSHAGTYGCAGRVESRAAVVSGLDVSL